MNTTDNRGSTPRNISLGCAAFALIAFNSLHAAEINSSYIGATYGSWGTAANGRSEWCR